MGCETARVYQLLGGAAAAWPLAARAQQPAMPVIGFLSGRSLASDGYLVAAFRQALNESGFVEGRNLVIEFRWADGQLNRLPLLAAELVERKVAVVFVGAADVASGAIRIVAATLPVVFATGSDPVASASFPASIGPVAISPASRDYRRALAQAVGAAARTDSRRRWLAFWSIRTTRPKSPQPGSCRQPLGASDRTSSC